MNHITYLTGPFIEVTAVTFNELKTAAQKAPLRRARICFHKNEQDPQQEMIIAICKDSYIRPHRHRNRPESITLIEGEAGIVFFNDKGNIDKIYNLGSTEQAVRFYRLNTDRWHMLLPISDFVIIHETAFGPFIKNEQDQAPWSPDYQPPQQITAYMNKIRNALDQNAGKEQ